MTNLVWHTEKRKIRDLVPHAQNPRQMTERQAEDLKKSLQKFDLVEIPAINLDNVILAGHQRLKIMALLGRGSEEVDVRVPSRQLTPEEAKEYVVRSNLNTGSFDFEMLASNFNFDELVDWGFDKNELQKGFDLNIAPTDKDDQLPEKTPGVAKNGELWQIGRHRMLVGDSTIRDNVIKLMDGKMASMTFTDPPYNVNYTGGTGNQAERDTILNDKMDREKFREFLEKVIANILEVTGGGVYICMSSSEIDTLKVAFEKQQGHFQSLIIWVKNQFTLTRSDYQNSHEPILYGWPQKVVNHYFINRRDLSNVWEDLRKVKTEFDGEYTTISFQGFKIKLLGKIEKGEVIRKKEVIDIWRHDKPVKSELHPTMKPVALVMDAITNSSLNDQIVFDPFLGSGTTIIACEKSNRICYGIELDEHYASVILQRFFDFTGQDPVRISDGKKWSELKPNDN